MISPVEPAGLTRCVMEEGVRSQESGVREEKKGIKIREDPIPMESGQVNRDLRFAPTSSKPDLRLRDGPGMNVRL